MSLCGKFGVVVICGSVNHQNNAGRWRIRHASPIASYL